MKTKKLEDSIELLKMAFDAHKKNPEDKLINAAMTKAFEVSFEYLWKYFKQKGSEEGYEIYSPRDSIKAALSMKLIQSSEQWDLYLTHRNLSVHDYVGVDSKDTPTIVKKFLKDIERIEF